MSVDGFVAGPNGEKDWIFRHTGETSARWAAERLGQASLIAMGRLSYEGMADYWPTATGPFAPPMNAIPKAVFSRSRALSPPRMETSTGANADPAVLEGWRNPLLAGADLVADIRRLKAEGGRPIVALGGASFASSLIAANLVDQFRLAVFPVVLGRGLPLFTELKDPLDLKLEELERFDTGVVVKTYRPRDAA